MSLGLREQARAGAAAAGADHTRERVHPGAGPQGGLVCGGNKRLIAKPSARLLSPRDGWNFLKPESTNTCRMEQVTTCSTPRMFIPPSLAQSIQTGSCLISFLSVLLSWLGWLTHLVCVAAICISDWPVKVLAFQSLFSQETLNVVPQERNQQQKVSHSAHEKQEPLFKNFGSRSEEKLTSGFTQVSKNQEARCHNWLDLSGGSGREE